MIHETDLVAHVIVPLFDATLVPCLNIITARPFSKAKTANKSWLVRSSCRAFTRNYPVPWPNASNTPFVMLLDSESEYMEEGEAAGEEVHNPPSNPPRTSGHGQRPVDRGEAAE